jgi:hypothetical protein
LVVILIAPPPVDEDGREKYAKFVFFSHSLVLDFDVKSFPFFYFKELE